MFHKKQHQSSLTCQNNTATAAGFTHNNKERLILPWIAELNWLSLAILSLMRSSPNYQVVQQAAELQSPFSCGFVSQDQASIRILSFLLNGSLSDPQHL